MYLLYSSRIARSFLFVAIALSISGCSATALQQARRAPATPIPAANPSPQPTPGQTAGETINRATSEPYTGELSIFEYPERDKKLQIERVMNVLGIKEGSSVADVGAGSGWFTVRAARRAGASGTVYAVEINQEYLDHIAKRAAAEKLSNVRTVLGTEDDPALPAASVDAVLILKTYHEIAQPVRVLTRLRASLRDGAKVGIIDRNGNGEDHGVSREVVIKEAAQAGFTLAESYDFVKPDGMDYFLVFKVRQ